MAEDYQGDFWEDMKRARRSLSGRARFISYGAWIDLITLVCPDCEGEQMIQSLNSHFFSCATCRQPDGSSTLYHFEFLLGFLRGRKVVFPQGFELWDGSRFNKKIGD